MSPVPRAKTGGNATCLARDAFASRVERRPRPVIRNVHPIHSWGRYRLKMVTLAPPRMVIGPMAPLKARRRTPARIVDTPVQA